jgi:hypothetical protein
MTTTINRIVELAEPADPERYRAYLQTLHEGALRLKLATLEADQTRDHAPNWSRIRTDRAASRRLEVQRG